MIQFLHLVRRAVAGAILVLFRREIESMITKRLLLFHEALIGRGQILPPQRFYSGDQRALLAMGS